MRSVPYVSAAICTHNRANWLRTCLDGFRAQTCDTALFEVLVVDNASTDSTRQVFEDYSAVMPNVRYVHEPELGLSAARNAAIRAAEGEVIAYIDDDAKPHRDWIDRIGRAFAEIEPHPAAVGGEICPQWGRTPPPWINNPVYRQMITAGLGWSTEAKFLHPPEWICEVNSAYRKDILEKYGPWPTDLGRKGALLLSNENVINQAMVEAGEPIYFDPRILVDHHIHADRLNQSWFRKRMFWQGVSAGIIANRYRSAGVHDDTLKLPASEEAWLETFSEANTTTEFESQCETIQHMGFLIARLGYLDGI